MPDYVQGISREAESRFLKPSKELLHGWGSFGEYVLDVSNSISKPGDPTIPHDDIDAQDEQDRQKFLPANDWEESIVDKLKRAGLGHLIPKFRRDMQDYRQAVKFVVRLWRDSGLL